MELPRRIARGPGLGGQTMLVPQVFRGGPFDYARGRLSGNGQEIEPDKHFFLDVTAEKAETSSDNLIGDQKGWPASVKKWAM